MSEARMNAYFTQRHYLQEFPKLLRRMDQEFFSKLNLYLMLETTAGINIPNRPPVDLLSKSLH